MADFKAIFDNFLGGFSPGYWKDTYPVYGNFNMAGDMKNVDLTNPSYITQGPGLTALTGATIGSIVKGMLPYAQSNDVCFGVGGDTLYKFGQSSAVSGTSFPHTISGTGVEGQDVEYYNSKILYSYNTSTSGCVGEYNISGDSFNDTLTQSLEAGVPHDSVVGGTDGVWAVTNKNKVATYNGTTWTTDAFSTHDDDSVTVSVVWNKNRFQIAANKPYIESGTNKMLGSVYTWDGSADSWETRAEVKGEIGTLFVKDGTTYVFYKENLNENICKIGRLVEDTIVPLDRALWQGSLPKFYQVTEYNNFVCFISGDKVMCYGSTEPGMPPMMFYLTTLTYSTGGGITSVFEVPIVSSSSGSSYELAKFDGYKTDCYWKSTMFDMRGSYRMGQATKVRTDLEKLASGCRVDFSLVDNKGNTLWTDNASYSNDGAVTKKDLDPKAEGENARLEIDWSNGSSSNPTKVKRAKVFGQTL